MNHAKRTTVRTPVGVAKHCWPRGLCVCVCVCVLVLVAQCPTLCHPIDCSPLGFSVHGILQKRILEWVAISSSTEASVGVAKHCLLRGWGKAVGEGSDGCHGSQAIFTPSWLRGWGKAVREGSDGCHGARPSSLPHGQY